MRFELIQAKKADYPIGTLCDVLEVSRSGYYSHFQRGESKRAREDRRLTLKIREAHKASRGTYGSPRVYADLKEQDFEVGKRRIARLMRESGIVGCPLKYWKTTTLSDHDNPIAPNLVMRNFEASGPNELWGADITYIRTWEGWAYLSVVMDLYSRRIVGWSFDNHMRTELILDALKLALGRRAPQPGLVHHSDRGVQYSSDRYRSALKKAGVECSMSRQGDCWDNAMEESFFATLKRELVAGRSFTTKNEAKATVIEYIENFYNCRRRHSSLGYMSPLEYETKGTQDAA